MPLLRRRAASSSCPIQIFQFQLRKFGDAMVSNVRPSLLLLQGAVILVLLISCANLANLLLMRMTVRKREFAIRGAIGAGRGRILRQLIVESLLLCSFGCVVGVTLGLIGARALLIASPNAFRTSENPVVRSGSIGGSWFLQLGFDADNSDFWSAPCTRYLPGGIRKRPA